MQHQPFWPTLRESIGLDHYWKQSTDFWQEKLVGGAILSTLNYLWICSLGALDVFYQHTGIDLVLLTILPWIMVVDLVLGLGSAWRRNVLSPTIFLRGILKWPLYSVYIGLVGVMNIVMSRLTPWMAPILNIFLGYLICAEVMSIIQKTEALGWRVPRLLLIIVHGFKDFCENKVKRMFQYDQDGSSLKNDESLYQEDTHFEENYDRGQIQVFQKESQDEILDNSPRK